MVAFAGSDAWLIAQSVIESLAKRTSDRCSSDDVIGETTMRLYREIAKGRPIHNLVGYVARLVASAQRSFRGRFPTALVDLELLSSEERRPSFDELVSRPSAPIELLRGATQRRIASGVMAGQDHQQIAEELGMSARIVRRQIRRLSQVMSGR
jgi:DNA-directed RNA polymerase specialized sigma24 family protein